MSGDLDVLELLGRYATLTIRRFGSPGAFLAIDASNTAANAPVLLLIGSEIPENAKEGDELRVFVYADSEGRPIATTRAAKLERGQVTFLQVTACTSFGSFVEWGLAKELLVPFAEQTTEMSVGSRYPIGLYLDKSGRLAGTMRVTEMLRGERAEFQEDAWVDGEAWRNDPRIGLFVIVERAFVGLMPASEPHRLSRGEAARFRVTSIMPDGKIELSLRRHAHEELAGDAQRILDVLSGSVTPRIGDRSSPEEVRALFGLSKKAFKRAVGRLLKQGVIGIDSDGWIVRALVGTTDACENATEGTSGNAAAPPFETQPQKAGIPMGQVIDKTKGKIKEIAGTLTRNDALKAKGELDQAKGAVKGALENVKDAIKHPKK